MLNGPSYGTISLKRDITGVPSFQETSCLGRRLSDLRLPIMEGTPNHDLQQLGDAHHCLRWCCERLALG